MKKVTILSEETKKLIIEKWKTLKINSINEIAKEVDVKPAKVKAIINEYSTNVNLGRG